MTLKMKLHPKCNTNDVLDSLLLQITQKYIHKIPGRTDVLKLSKIYLFVTRE